ncbi:MAG TPA: molecular chaperone, partial [Stenotrophomonas sp.]|nr:molecular chaperone [Stenotrophomonas sp.]
PENVRTPFRLTPAEPRLLQAHQGQAYRITYAPRPSEAALPND